MAGVEEDNLRRAINHGESSRTPKGRFEEHMVEYRKKDVSNFLWNHTLQVHGGVVTPGGGGDDEGRTDYVNQSFRDPTTRKMFEWCFPSFD